MSVLVFDDSCQRGGTQGSQLLEYLLEGMAFMVAHKAQGPGVARMVSVA